MGGGGGLLGDVTDAIGLTDYEGQEEAAARAAEASKYATDQSLAVARENIKFQKEELEWQKQQYNQWYEVYGNLQENLGEYYKNLSGTEQTSKQLQALSTEYSRATKDLQRQLAQAGIQGGGIEAATRTAMAATQASQRASVRANQDQTARALQQQFLGIGLGQGTAMLGIQAQQAGTVGSAYNVASSNVLQGGLGQANIQAGFANNLMAQNAQSTGQFSQGITAGSVYTGVKSFFS